MSENKDKKIEEDISPDVELSEIDNLENSDIEVETTIDSGETISNESELAINNITENTQSTIIDTVNIVATDEMQTVKQNNSLEVIKLTEAVAELTKKVDKLQTNQNIFNDSIGVINSAFDNVTTNTKTSNYDNILKNVLDNI